MALIIKVSLLIGFLILQACSGLLPDEVVLAYNNLPSNIDFNFQVRPILSDRCYKCHGPDASARKADLRLDAPESAFSKLKDKEGFAIVPGEPGASMMINRILSDDPEHRMPPPDSKLNLTSAEKAVLVKWVEQGAKWKKHWAFVLPQKSDLPQVRGKDWPRNPIDYFVLQNLESRGLSPSPEASKETLIRRLSFDLTGLPPTMQEIENFQKDNSTSAYETLVDRLLASPRYGERWCWEWLDVARYADTNGFQNDPTRHMWPWRDWVIQAFNDNMPYDQFTVEQLAGDLLPNAGVDDILATAFNRNNMYNGEGGRIPEETRVENVLDRVETMGTVWLGLTLNCSRCHDHKFDPITQQEYYQFYDYFNQTSEEGIGYHGRVEPVLDLSPTDKLEKVAELQDFVDHIAANLESLESKKFPRSSNSPASESVEAEELDGDSRYALGYTPNQRNPYYLGLLFNYYEKRDPEYARLLLELKEAKSKRDKQSSNNLQVMVMNQLDHPRPTFILDRGTYNRHMEQVSMNVPAVLPSLPEDAPKNRLALANWLVTDNHPLTARVTVNRYWQAFFGTGIVKTIEDFGVQGALPTHPKLLDWLAVDFEESGWNLKGLFKTIVMSATYRQSSKVSEKAVEIDPENKYLSRASRMRLPSWMLRDQALYISGLMVDSLGGKPVNPYQPSGIWEEATFGFIKYQQDHGDALYRRTLYTFWRRIVGPTVLFDNSTRQTCSVRAMRTNTPLHALITLNDVTFMEAARAMAGRVLTEKVSDDDRPGYAFELATSRKPTSDELKILQNRLRQLRKQYAGAPEDAREIIAIGEHPTNEKLDPIDYASYAVLCSLVLNLDETITRQ